VAHTLPKQGLVVNYQYSRHIHHTDTFQA